MSDLLLDEKEIGPGMQMPMGAVDMMMVDYDAYAKTVGAQARGIPAASQYGRLQRWTPRTRRRCCGVWCRGRLTIRRCLSHHRHGGCH